MYKNSNYTVKRLVKEVEESAQNLSRKSAQKLSRKSAQNCTGNSKDNSLTDNSVVITPQAGNDDKKEKILKDMKEVEKENVVISEFVSAPSDTSFRNDFKKDVDNGSVPFTRNMSLTYIIKSFSIKEKKHLKKEGISEEEFARVKKNIDGSSGNQINPLQAKKLSESEKKSLQDFIKKYSKSNDTDYNDLILEAKKFLMFGFTASSYSADKLDILICKIKKLDNVVRFDFSSNIERERKAW
jgi:hypothetical protein